MWHLFVVRTKERDRLQKYLFDHGVQTIIHYPIPPHQQAAYSEWNELHLPLTEQINNQVLSLPISPVLSRNEAEKVVEILNQYR
ncbi:DegT/DnrJ/EryC1/StrS family aminotransferase [Effusibacillus consociatus]|uniref:DegT/DnrJ/EryC1/StrS family aminotransferase n=1 Tax=Effusibacillus consociatus TaxID=1117041 RepID=A0ABV9Q7M4_9BACL